LKYFRHLVLRFFGAISGVQPSLEELIEVESLLLDSEFLLWRKLPMMDQRHSIAVLRRFISLRPGATRPELRAALLHDIGKIQSNLGVLGRVVATLVGRRGERFTVYHDHEKIGSEMLQNINSDLVTIRLVAGTNQSDIAGALSALRAADNT
jgi:HD domain